MKFLIVVILIGFACAQDCLLVVPPNPLTAAGLSSPYILESVNPATPCSQTGDGASFVQGAVVDLVTGQLFVYNPLVINKGTSPANAPVVPKLPDFYVAALWFGTNGDTLTLVANNNSLSDGNCVNGIAGSIFGQFSYCNAPTFFIVVNSLIASGKIAVPRLGTAKDGQPCPTTRSFFIVDQDQSDNVVTSYLITKTGKLAQNTAANRKAFPNSTVLDNGSDEGLVVLVNNGLGCASWQVSDLADPGSSLASLPMNEVMASIREPAPIALVPAGDPMVLDNNGQLNLGKTNAYRFGVDQSLIFSLNQASTTTYCRHLANIFPTRMLNPTTKKLLSAQPSPDTQAANNLYNFLAQRFVATLQNLNCSQNLGPGVKLNSMVTLTTDSDGCVTDTAINAEMIPEDSTSESVESGASQIETSVVSLAIVVLWILLL